MNDDLVSVVVPIYNVEQYLTKCIESIINQTYKNLEIFLIDDGSTDESGKICDRYAKKDNRIKVIHKKNAGVSSARNTGIDNSTGKWLAFIDADDWIEENYIEELLKNTSKEIDIVQCGYNRMVGDKKEKTNCEGKDILHGKDEFLIKCLNPQTAYGLSHMKIIRKSIINEIRFNEKIVVCEDALFNIEISKNLNKFKMIKQPLYNYRINQNSVVKKYDGNYSIKYENSLKIIFDYLKNNYSDNNLIKQNYYNFSVYHLMLIAVNYCFNPSNKEKRKVRQLSNICNKPIFKEAIKKSDYNNISITRKITLWTLKNKLYYITAIICIIRQKQNRNN